MEWQGITCDCREQPIWIQEALGQPAFCEGGKPLKQRGLSLDICRVQQITNTKDVQPPTCFFTIINQCQKDHMLFSQILMLSIAVFHHSVDSLGVLKGHGSNRDSNLSIEKQPNISIYSNALTIEETL